MTILLKCLLFTTLFTLTQTFNWLGTPDSTKCSGRIPASASCIEGDFADFDQVVSAVIEEDKDKLYDSMKAEFLSSPFCEADKVLSDPTQRVNPIVFNNVITQLGFITNGDYDRSSKKMLFENFVEKYELSSDFKSYGLELLNGYEDNASARFIVMTRLRGLALQEIDQISKVKPSYQVEDITIGLAKKGIFVPDEDTGGTCPFVGREAFMKALQGREKMLKTPALANRISKKDQITIVDYSQPSNQRRMFVIDLKTGKVIHNTWAAHGRGDGSQDAGVDGWGSSPKMSNANGSNLSSEGFIIAGAASSGTMYGPNVIFDGVDFNNTKLKSRAVVLHGWRTPLHEYVSGKWDWNAAQTKRILPAPDSYPAFLKTDFKNGSEDEMVDGLDELRSGASNPDYKMDGTNGCIGVPEANAKQLDRKGRNKSQLELLREDLPGSIIMNYSGSEMKSKFF